MNQKTLELLEYNIITEQLADFARTEAGKERLLELRPETNPLRIEKRLAETSEARAIVDTRSAIPIHSLVGVDAAFILLDKGGVLSPTQCETVSGFIGECRKLKTFMQGMAEMAPVLSGWASAIDPLAAVQEEIAAKIACGEIDSGASPVLLRLTRAMQKTDERIKSRIEGVIRDLDQKHLLQETHVSQRNGRYVVAVKSAQWRSVPGAARDRSASGSTVFIEPEAVRLLQDELDQQKLAAELERERILSEISAMLAEHRQALDINKECVIAYDVIIAKGKLSRSMSGIPAALRKDDRVVIKGGRHPLIGEKAVPLDFQLPDHVRGLIITGPNTGGKTVVLKTVGLFAAMTQAGLHIPAQKGTSCGVFADIQADIGDGQSLTQNLSTFSAHMTTISEVLKSAGPRVLVLLDEMGSGTDPAEGMGLAAAILEELYGRGAMILATTHFVEIKRFGDHQRGFINGAMGFDLATLSPRYQLTIGSCGQSHGLHIAERLGLPGTIIARARAIVGQEVEPEQIKETNGVHFIPADKEPPPEKVVNTSSAEATSLMASKNIDKAFEALEAEEDTHFSVGDAVSIAFLNDIGIIVAGEDRKGEYVVQIHGKRVTIGKKRLKLYIPGEELYPEGYNLDIVTKSKTHRKLENKIRKGHKGFVLVHKE